MSALSSYINQFAKLRVSSSGGFKAPHKAILLITITEMVRDGYYDSTHIENNRLLSMFYEKNWHQYIQINTPFVCNVDMPFEHIGSEPFCTQLSRSFIVLDDDLFDLMAEQEDAEAIITTLIANYLAPFANKHKVDFSELNPYRDKQLRPYQIEAKEKIYKMWIQKRSVMFQMPTGTGKTRLFVSIIRDLFDWGASKKIVVKVLVLAHRIELIDQIDEHIGLKYNLAHGLIVSKSREQKMYSVQIGSVPTLTRRLSNWTDKEFDIIIIDEAHHVKADSYRRILKEFPKAKVLGVTATPYRMNHASFHPEFDDLITSQPVLNFIRQGYLCDYDYYSIRPNSRIQSDIDSITQFALDGDYLDIAMLDVMDKDEIRAGIVDAYFRYARGKKGIVYTINRDHNIHVCSKFAERGINAVAIDSKTPPDERKQMVDDFKRGKIDIICNVNIFSEGFDCPDVEFIQLARPTKSLSMYLQQVGRGLRPADGKEKLIIIDCVGLYNRFGFPSAKRKWRHHFEGRDVDYTPHSGVCSLEERDVIFMDDYEEGDEEVEILHSSSDEIITEVPEVETFDIYSYENEFKYFLSRKRYNDDTIEKLVKGLKNDVDIIIKSKYNSKHTSVLNIDDISSLELYMQDFDGDLAISGINKQRRNILTSSLATYIEFQKWVEAGRPEEEFDMTEDDTDERSNIEDAPKRSLEEVKAEIAIFKKYNSTIPQPLLQELDDIINSGKEKEL